MEKISSTSTQRWRPCRMRSAALLGVLGVLASSCVDPVREAAIEALGPEKGNVPPGPLHRPGQPCLVCHSEDGDSEAFTLAGTVYFDAKSDTPVDNVQVMVMDSKGKTFTASTNCAGNFFVRPKEFTPTFPIWVEMQGGTAYRSMESASFREGSCAHCHSDPVGPASAGHVYLIDDPSVEEPPPSQCR